MTKIEPSEKQMIKSNTFGDEIIGCYGIVKQFWLEKTLRNVGRPKIKNAE